MTNNLAMPLRAMSGTFVVILSIFTLGVWWAFFLGVVRLIGHLVLPSCRVPRLGLCGLHVRFQPDLALIVPRVMQFELDCRVNVPWCA